MTTPTPAPTSPSSIPHTTTTHNLALLLLIASPLLIALPPRKLDLYTASLITAFAVSANHLTHERTGTGLLEHASLRLHRAVTPAPRPVVLGADGRGMAATGRQGRGEEEAKGVAGLARKLWMGQEGEGWQEERARVEREKLAAGRGYSGLIVDQIWEVCNWDKKVGKEGEGAGAGQGAGEKAGEGEGREVGEGEGREANR